VNCHRGSLSDDILMLQCFFGKARPVVHETRTRRLSFKTAFLFLHLYLPVSSLDSIHLLFSVVVVVIVIVGNSVSGDVLRFGIAPFLSSALPYSMSTLSQEWCLFILKSLFIRFLAGGVSARCQESSGVPVLFSANDCCPCPDPHPISTTPERLACHTST